MINFIKNKYLRIFENRIFFEAVIYIIHYIGRLLFNLRIMRLCKLKEETIETKQIQHKDFDFLKILPCDIHHFEYNQYTIKQTDIDIAIKNNDFLYIAVLKNTKKIVCYGWYSTRETTINQEFIFQFPSNYVYMYNGYTEPEYRGHRLHALTMKFAAIDAYSNNYKGLVSFVDFENYRSIRSCQRLGYKFFGFIFIITLFKHTFILRCPQTISAQINLIQEKTIHKPEQNVQQDYA
jgi:hypothetical protein